MPKSSPALDRRTALRIVAAAAALVAGPRSPPAQAAAPAIYPDRPVTLVVPWPTGGTNDLLARLIAAEMGKGLGQRVIVENRAGASGTIGAGVVARAEPDGHTILWGSVVTQVLGPALNHNAPYDPATDFEPISLLALVPGVLLVNPSLPAANARELVALLRGEPGGYAYASAGYGTPMQLAAELFEEMAGVDMLHVPYTGSGPALTAAVGGQVPIVFDLLPSATGHIRSGSLRALAVTTARRVAALPDVPTMAEAAGLAGYEISAWNGLYAPARTPRAIIDRLAVEARRALAEPALRARLEELGAVAAASTPEELGERAGGELARWAPVLNASGVHPDG